MHACLRFFLVFTVLQVGFGSCKIHGHVMLGGLSDITGGQSVSHVFLWQPSECVHLIVNCVILFSENKYDDDDDIGVVVT